MVVAGAELLTHVQAVARHGSGPGAWASPGRTQCVAVARVPELAGRLVRWAVLADRRAGASWAQIGAALGISAEAARSRFGRVRRSPTGASPGW